MPLIQPQSFLWRHLNRAERSDYGQIFRNGYQGRQLNSQGIEAVSTRMDWEFPRLNWGFNGPGSAISKGGKKSHRRAVRQIERIASANGSDCNICLLAAFQGTLCVSGRTSGTVTEYPTENCSVMTGDIGKRSPQISDHVKQLWRICVSRRRFWAWMIVPI